MAVAAECRVEGEVAKLLSFLLPKSICWVLFGFYFLLPS